MEPIPAIGVNTAVPDEVLAQTVAALSDWPWDLTGMIFDERGRFISRCLTTLGAVRRSLDWFISMQSPVIGVDWSSVPDVVRKQAEIILASTRRP